MLVTSLRMAQKYATPYFYRVVSASVTRVHKLIHLFPAVDVPHRHFKFRPTVDHGCWWYSCDSNHSTLALLLYWYHFHSRSHRWINWQAQMTPWKMSVSKQQNYLKFIQSFYNIPFSFPSIPIRNNFDRPQQTDPIHPMTAVEAEVEHLAWAVSFLAWYPHTHLLQSKLP